MQAAATVTAIPTPIPRSGPAAHVSDLPVYTAPAAHAFYVAPSAHALPIAGSGSGYVAPSETSSGIGVFAAHSA
jgi:hypothetical protein